MLKCQWNWTFDFFCIILMIFELNLNDIFICWNCINLIWFDSNYSLILIMFQVSQSLTDQVSKSSLSRWACFKIWDSKLEIQNPKSLYRNRAGRCSSRAYQNWLWIFGPFFGKKIDFFFLIYSRDIMQVFSADDKMFFKKNQHCFWLRKHEITGL